MNTVAAPATEYPETLTPSDVAPGYRDGEHITAAPVGAQSEDECSSETGWEFQTNASTYWSNGDPQCDEEGYIHEGEWLHSGKRELWEALEEIVSQIKRHGEDLRRGWQFSWEITAVRRAA